MKTFEGWVASMLSLDQYLGFIPCTIDRSFMEDIAWHKNAWFCFRVHYYLFQIGGFIFETQLIFINLGKFGVYLGEWPTVRRIKKHNL
jgi:hypothetical protein